MATISKLGSISLRDSAPRFPNKLPLSDCVRLKLNLNNEAIEWTLVIGLSYNSSIETCRVSLRRNPHTKQSELFAPTNAPTMGPCLMPIVDWTWAERLEQTYALTKDGSCLLFYGSESDPSQRCIQTLSKFEGSEVVISLLEVADHGLIILCKSPTTFQFYILQHGKLLEHLTSLPNLMDEPNPVMCVVSLNDLNAAMCALLMDADAVRVGGSLLVIGSHAGEIYGFPLNRQGPLRVLCQLHQPLVGAFTTKVQSLRESSNLLFVGEEGKILMISWNGSNIVIRTDFLIGPILQCCYSNGFLFCNSENTITRVKLQFPPKDPTKPSKCIIEEQYYPVKNVRTFIMTPDSANPVIFCLTEDAIVYAFPFDLPTIEKARLHISMDTALGHLERIGQEMKHVSEQKENIDEKLKQSSLALRMLNRRDLETLITIDMRTYSVAQDVDEECILLDMENKSKDSFLPGYWSLCISMGSEVANCLCEPLVKIWKPGEVMQVNRRVKRVWESWEDVSFHLSLNFTVDEALIPIPVCSATLTLMNFLEPASSHLGRSAAEGQSFEDFLLDVAKGKPVSCLYQAELDSLGDSGSPRTVVMSTISALSVPEFAQYLLEGSFHRGFEHLQLEQPGNTIHLPLAVGDHRLDLYVGKNEEKQMYLLRVSCQNKKVFKRTLTALIEKIQHLTAPEVKEITLHAKVLADVQRLKRRFDFVMALPNVEASHMAPIIEDLNEVFIDNFPLR